jgi:hypothetical protein
VLDNSPRQDVLYKAIEVITGDRNMDYDEPSRNFEVIADLWSIYLGIEIHAHDVALLNILQKVSRMMTSPGKEDHWIDIAGYAGCGWETLS